MAQTKTPEAPAKRGRKPGSATMPKAVREVGLARVELAGASDAEVVRPPGRYDEQVRWSFEQSKWLQALAPGYTIRRDADGNLEVSPYDARFKPGKDTEEASVTPEDHAKAILAEIRKSADSLGYGLRTLPLVETKEGVLVQAKARKRKERKPAEATATT